MKKSITHVNYYRKLKLQLIKVAHFLLSVALFFLAWMYFRYKGNIPVNEAGFRYNFFITWAYAVILFFFSKTTVRKSNKSILLTPFFVKLPRTQKFKKNYILFKN